MFFYLLKTEHNISYEFHIKILKNFKKSVDKLFFIEYIINVNRCRSEEKGYFEMSNLFPFSNVSRQFKYQFVVVAKTDTSCHYTKRPFSNVPPQIHISLTALNSLWQSFI